MNIHSLNGPELRQLRAAKCYRTDVSVPELKRRLIKDQQIARTEYHYGTVNLSTRLKENVFNINRYLHETNMDQFTSEELMEELMKKSFTRMDIQLICIFGDEQQLQNILEHYVEEVKFT